MCCMSGDDCATPGSCSCTAASACSAQHHYTCDDPSDCPTGLVCCATVQLAGSSIALTTATCLAPASCVNDGFHTQLCDPTSLTVTCPSGSTCKPSAAKFPGVGYCIR
jgi:hypothetical protein